MEEPQEQDLALPPLRDDLQIIKGAPTLQGEPTWTIIDPVRNQYIQIGWAAYQMLARWKRGTCTQLINRLATDTTCQVTQKDVEELILFLNANHLTQAPLAGGSAAFVEQAEAGKQNWVSWAIHQYLFFKVPLTRPDSWLKNTLPYLSPFMTPMVGILITILGVVGLIMVSRQWETFTNTFLHMFSLEGMAAFGIALCGVKLLHELGHAYTATKYGCRVHTMGVAFLVMFPVLYTDTTDAWRLTSRRERLHIAAAGVIVELAVAMLATFMWNFLPAGILRSVAFSLATTSWLMSMTINLNPFLRFDGYYFFSDWLGVPNLQQRAFAFGRWKLREWVFGIGAKPPETFAPKMQTMLIGYAWSVWIFRFFLFLGIAALVYHFFFKLLGLCLFAVEIVWFILMPISYELIEWWKLREDILLTRRVWISGAILGILILLLCIPWNARVSIPAILQAQQHTTIYSPTPARLVEMTMVNGQSVTKGEQLARLESLILERDILKTQQQVNSLELQLKRLGSDAEQLADKPVVMEELKMRISELDGLLEMQENLELKAPFTGVVVDLQTSLHPERWVNEKLPLARLIEPSEVELVALTPETDLARLAVGQKAKFIPDDPMRPISHAQIKEIREIDEETVVIPYLASVFGGDIAVRQDQEGNLYPETAIYRVTLDPIDQQPLDSQVVKGLIHITGDPRSLIGRASDVVMATLVREMGF